MDERIQQVLDGELSREALTPEETRELLAAESVIGGVLRDLPTQPLPDLSRSVLRQVGQRGRARSRAAWLWRPRPVSLQWRPVYALAAAAVIAVVLLVRSPEPRTALAPQHVLIEFRLDAPQAQRVDLAGDFSDWKPAYNLTRTRAGTWTIVVPLKPGVHEYAFVIDGQQWVADPMAPSVSDGFGGMNSRVAVLLPENRSL